MSITILTDVILPDEVIAAGIAGKNQRSNTRVMSGAGFVSVNINWSRTLRQYQLGVKPMSVAQWMAIEGLHEITEGGAYGFLMRDPKDQSAAHSEGSVIGWLGGTEVGTDGAGFGVASYRMRKLYATVSGSRQFTRNITRPVSGIEVKRGTNTVVFGTDPGEISLDYDTGVITFVADATQSIDSITVGSTTTLSFATSDFPDEFVANGRVWVTGTTGTAATLLNDKNHLITSVTGTDIVIDVATTGLAATGGTAKKYPQPSETISWAGSFYVPVHFANDDIDWEIILGGDPEDRIVAGQNVVLEEVRE